MISPDLCIKHKSGLFYVAVVLNHLFLIEDYLFVWGGKCVELLELIEDRI
jgi:hypothetical protein